MSDLRAFQGHCRWWLILLLPSSKQQSISMEPVSLLYLCRLPSPCCSEGDGCVLRFCSLCCTLQLSPASPSVMWEAREVLGPKIEDHFLPLPQCHIWTQHLFLFPFGAQGSSGWAVPQPDGASGREARCHRGKDADSAVPNAPGHHALGLGGHVPRAAYCPSLCGRTPPEVSDLASCLP